MALLKSNTLHATFIYLHYSGRPWAGVYYPTLPPPRHRPTALPPRAATVPLSNIITNTQPDSQKSRKTVCEDLGLRLNMHFLLFGIQKYSQGYIWKLQLRDRIPACADIHSTVSFIQIHIVFNTFQGGTGIDWSLETPTNLWVCGCS